MIEQIYEKFLNTSGICTDSRAIRQNSMFVCLKGANFDGNAFAGEALEKGAAYVITENSSIAGNERAIVVNDSLATLQHLAHLHREKMCIPVVGITGTNGKTTTKELINAVLSTTYKTCCTKGNLNNHIGVPLTLLSISKDDEIAIVEMGANHVGEIADLCRIADPDAGLITNIGVAHIEGFGSKENIVKTKKALYQHVMKSDGTLFVNKSDSLLCEGLSYEKVVFYGEDSGTRIVSMDTCLTIRLWDRTVKTNLTGSYNIVNFLAAAAVGEFFNVRRELVCKALSEYTPSNHRSQVSVVGTNTVISDYYNANLTSMTAALENLALLKGGRKAAVLGDMLELGSLSGQAHTEVVAMTEKMGIEAYFVGAEFSKVANKNVFSNVEAANEYFTEHPFNDALVLVKGSNGIHLNRLTAVLGNE
ncbi:MAG: UDP-N-acetylmuramoyl-tripeptide--D-alanyl-D-alanine ligase [Bacteroidales bacterium]|nr:UDP-N-acetylmuramoyl-tripeptide--D-alanyl-D-alanine ligase [Bacteroidales bacterium]